MTFAYNIPIYSVGGRVTRHVGTIYIYIYMCVCVCVRLINIVGCAFIDENGRLQMVV
jgi:hypothetical protein